MSDKKRKAKSAAKEPAAKQQKLANTKKKAGGWLQEMIKQQRTENKELCFNEKRLRFMSDTEEIKQGSEGVLYWMLRDHRVQGEHFKDQVLPVFFMCLHSDQVLLCVLDNWALIHAQQLAMKEKLPLHICVCLHVPKSELSTLRHYSFMLKGLEEVAKVHKDRADKTASLKVTHITTFDILVYSATVKQECKALHIQFHLLHGSAGEVLPGFVSERHLGAVVTDFSPLREPLKWLEDVKKKFPKDIPLIQVNSKSDVNFDCFFLCL